MDSQSWREGTPLAVALAHQVRRIARVALPISVGAVVSLTCREVFASEGWGTGASAFAFGTSVLLSSWAFHRPTLEASMGGGALNALLIGLAVVVLGLERMRADYVLAVSLLLLVLFAVGAFLGVVVGFSFRPFVARKPGAPDPDAEEAVRLPFLLSLWFSSAALLVDWVGPGGPPAAGFAAAASLAMLAAAARFFRAHSWVSSLPDPVRDASGAPMLSAQDGVGLPDARHLRRMGFIAALLTVQLAAYTVALLVAR